ncbi:MAG TPA: Cache 3/Cache 2 fusion domain-containing protein [Methanospirillum sp.]|uniref:methyl-accepting chemotaxis protein n=1 Tax=Methanospirillum sp. TaxID=45200 RepID=UPI002C6A21AB|nr:Cache 3/Cache 2 fusion domain-containing protein [Methanospirillum sp.]HOJ96390.1 Cache 3/Cache 2 fusion domain-containing protein [Methanospirillum sp.]HPP77457.1 Cache 3/Cache 2 fusion domain-containing protein [Methanospirillum sp.]
MRIKESITDWFDNATIGRKITLICLILVIIPTLILGFVAYTSAESAIHDSILLNLKTQSQDLEEATKTAYDLTMVKVKSDLNVLHENFYAKGKPEIINGNLMLGSSYKVNDNFEIVDTVQRLLGGAATIFQKKGNQAIRISTNVIGEDGKRAIGTPVSDKVYDEVMNKGQTYYGTANVVGKKYITAYEPIKNAANEIIGILFVGVEEASTIGILQDQIKNKKIGENGYVYVLDSSGTALIHPTREGKNDSDLPFIKEIITKKEGELEYSWEGKDKIAVFSYFEPFDWIIVATADHHDFTGPIDAIRNTIILVVILGIAGGFFVATLFGRSLSTRMDELVSLARQVRDGNLSGRTDGTFKKDEIGILGQAFTDVVLTFQNFRDEVRMLSAAAASGDLKKRGDISKFQGDYALIIQGVNDTVDAMAVPLNEAMALSKRYASGDFTARMNPDLDLKGDFLTFRDALNTIGTEISQALEAVQIQMKELTRQMNEVSLRVDEVNAETKTAHKSIEDVSEGVSQVAAIATAVNDLADKSGMATQQILAAMQDLATTVSSVAAKMEHVSALTHMAAELSEKGKEAAGLAESGMHGIMASSSEIDEMNQQISGQMQEINRIVDIISSIAEETNLLALNAAIEAARAGEAGLGFAVVAAEVKELANESQKSAENIAAIISDLQKKSSAMAKAVQNSMTEVKNGNNAVSETLAVFNEIVDSISTINSNMSEVAAASEEQAASVEEVTATVNEFSEMVQQTAKESVGLAAASEESSAAVGQITQMVAQVNESMDRIKETTELAEQAVERIEAEMGQFTY